MNASKPKFWRKFRNMRGLCGGFPCNALLKDQSGLWREPRRGVLFCEACSEVNTFPRDARARKLSPVELLVVLTELADG